MKSLSMSGVAVATVLSILCSSFYVDKAAVHDANTSLLSVRDPNYYFYETDSTYDGYYTIAEEEANLELEYGVAVDTNSLGGTLLADGYVLYGLPHEVWPSVQLYAHY